MMTFEEVATMVESIGLPFTYYQWDEQDAIPDLPYIVFYYPSSDNFSADDIVYKGITNINIELYSKQKDFETEQSVETVLQNNGIFWDKYESYIESEEMYEVLYQFQIHIE